MCPPNTARHMVLPATLQVSPPATQGVHLPGLQQDVRREWHPQEAQGAVSCHDEPQDEVLHSSHQGPGGWGAP